MFYSYFGFVFAGAERMSLNVFMQLGTCYSPPFPSPHEVCKGVNASNYHFEMYHFDYVDYEKTYSASAMNAMALERYKRIETCSHAWDSYMISKIMVPIANMTNGGWDRRRN